MTLWQWLGFKAKFNFTRAKPLGIVLGVFLQFLLVFLLVSGLVGAIKLCVALIGYGPYAVDETGQVVRNIGLVLVGLFGAPFVIWRTTIAERQAEVAKQGQITDRINVAVEGLGAEKTVQRDGQEHTEPNMEVRIGAIYALERIAQDSDRDHVQIMEILCAYVRQNSPASSGIAIDIEPIPEERHSIRSWRRVADEKLAVFKRSLRPRSDIQTTLEVIGRRSGHQIEIEANRVPIANIAESIEAFWARDKDEDTPSNLVSFKFASSSWRWDTWGYRGFRLDLSGANLQGFRLSGAFLKQAFFHGSLLQGADLSAAQLDGANFNRVDLSGARLDFASIQGANLNRAKLIGTDLEQTNFQRSNLNRATLVGSHAMRDANFQGASFRKVDLIGIEHKLNNPEQVFGDKSTLFQSVQRTRPKFWNTKQLEYFAFYEESHRWLADPSGYVPPEPPFN
mmetsp:Transcript_17963/g.27331  ORF Transcript_17963/g.27331 Transcript_17963/m.27331 type:complete len:452 (-) Transcript_17963:119-1474(-)